MPKKQKSMKNSTRNQGISEKRSLVEKDEEQVYGLVTKTLGSSFFSVKCFDSKERRCKARKSQKRMRVEIGNIVIVSLRTFSDDTGDIVYTYDCDEARQLQKLGEIPATEYVENTSNTDSTDKIEDEAFEFDSI
jgi:translation initiation factor 1A